MAYQATKGGRLYAGGRSQKPQVPERLAPEAVRHKKGERRVKCDFNQADAMQAAADDYVLASSLKLMDRNKHVYVELAK
mgnify:FL=1